MGDGRSSPGATRVRAVCDAGADTTGLFVLFRAVARSASPSALVRSAEEASAHPPDAMHVAFVDAEGYLLPVRDDRNPWVELDPRGGETPHAIPMSVGTAYEGCLVRHPDPGLARSLARWIDRAEDDASWGFAHWQTPRVELARRLEIRSAGAGDIELVVPSSAEAFVPRGHADFGGWVLYHAMPLAELTSVCTAVRRLRAMLGALRYPHGGVKNPYLADYPVDDVDFSATLSAAVAAFQSDARRGDAVAVRDRAQCHGAAVPRVVTSPTEAQAKEHEGYSYASWRWIGGAPAIATRLVGGENPGVIDLATGNCLAEWHRLGLRKPGAVLVAVPSGFTKSWPTWLRDDAAIALLGWRVLAKAFGVPYSIAVGHTYRHVTDCVAKGSGGPGKASRSIHKTGLAMDLGVIGGAGGAVMDYSHPIPSSPLVYEGDWVPTAAAQRARARVSASAEALVTAITAHDTSVTKRDEAEASAGALPTSASRGERAQANRRIAAARKAERLANTTRVKAEKNAAKKRALAEALERGPGSATSTLRWRLYAHSTLGLLGSGTFESSMAELVAGLARCPGEFRAMLRALDASSGSGALALDPLCATFDAAVAALLGSAREATGRFVDGYFRAMVHPFVYDPVAANGGRPGAALDPANDHMENETLDVSKRTEREVPEGARSFVNLTRLAWHVGLVRIGAVKGFRQSDVDTRHPRSRAVVRKVFSTVVGLLEKFLRPGAKEQDARLSFPSRGPGADRSASDLDLARMRKWVKFLGSAGRLKAPKGGLNVRADVPRITLRLALPGFDGDLRAALALLEGEVADTPLALIESPTVLGVGDAPKSVRLAREWVSELKVSLETLRAASSANPSTPRTNRERCWVFHPLFERDAPSAGTVKGIPLFLPAENVEFPTPGVGRCLEWWHFQSLAANVGTWGSMLESLGLSPVVLGASAERPPVTDKRGAVNHFGVGYVPTDLSTATGPASAEKPDNGEDSRPRLVFALFYVSLEAADDDAHQRESRAWERESRAEFDLQDDFDQFVRFPVTFGADLNRRFAQIASIAKATGAMVAEGALFAPTSVTTVSGNATEVLALADGITDRAALSALPDLPWMPGARLLVAGRSEPMGSRRSR